MSYVEQNLISGEQVLYKTGLHWISLFWPVFVGALLFLASLGTMIGGATIMALLYLTFAGALVLFGILRRRVTEMAVTNKRILIKTGLLSRRTFELLLTKVESIGVAEGLLGRVLGY